MGCVLAGACALILAFSAHAAATAEESPPPPSQLVRETIAFRDLATNEAPPRAARPKLKRKEEPQHGGGKRPSEVEHLDQRKDALAGLAPSCNSTAARDDALWRLALGAAVPRGDVNRNGGVVGRLDPFGKRRKGPTRTDGKAWKAGEAGCPHKPAYEKIPGESNLVKGDERLEKIHFVHPPKSGGTSFGLVVIAAACELNKKYKK